MLRAIPTLPRARPSVWLVALAIAVTGGAIAIRTTLTSAEWVGEAFPGFVLLDNRVVASVGLAHWTGTTVPDLYQSEVLAVDGRPVSSTPGVYAAVREHPPGTTIRYVLERNGAKRPLDLASQVFGARDWFCCTASSS
jgi:hypothetical protein